MARPTAAHAAVAVPATRLRPKHGLPQSFSAIRANPARSPGPPGAVAGRSAVDIEDYAIPAGGAVSGGGDRTALDLVELARQENPRPAPTRFRAPRCIRPRTSGRRQPTASAAPAAWPHRPGR
ncbi:hypothetical protein GCM10009854_31590 [Saccharopolyspora halophila]|uniref:Uncharacterized protein n=1 Tax=Saccharopolyspora halophila TaxID=405551 RepID=A0ABP5TJ76_9PSEU